MAARAILEQYAERTGWDLDSMFEILCDYVDNQLSDDALEDYVSVRADEEDDLIGVMLALSREDIPSDFEVQPLGPDDAAERRTTCGTCGLSWDDARVTSMTPTPSARCPFEGFHKPDK